MGSNIIPEWIAVDWGTSHLRAYAMQGSTVAGRAHSSDGMSKLTREAFEPALVKLLKDWNCEATQRVVCCGMVGSRQGWVEAPYRAVPCAPLGATLTRAPSTTGLDVHVVSGLSQNAPADVMRGEETQIAGFLTLNPGWDGVLCLPGTHTKWAQLSAGEVVSFQTFMTGEMYALLGEQSVLRHSLDPAGWNAAAFSDAVAETLSQPEKLGARFFQLRANDLLHGTDRSATRASLSGYLIGAELAAARPYWLGQNIAILGTGAQACAYRDGLAPQGVVATLVDSERATLAGLTRAFDIVKGTS